MLPSLRQLNRADVVLSTVDTVGIPLMLLARAASCARRSSTPRSACPSGSRSFAPSACERLYARALGAASAIVAYSEHEADVLAAMAR